MICVSICKLFYLKIICVYLLMNYNQINNLYLSYTHMSLKKKAFTLVELIVVITILAVLATVAFISFQWYGVSSRDAARFSDIRSVEKVLELYHTQKNIYPNPENFTSITYSWSIAWNQWIYGNTANTWKSSLSNVPVDPLTKLPYAYSVTNIKQEYQLWAVLESPTSKWNTIISSSFANNIPTQIYVRWNYNWEIVKVNTDTVSYLLWVPSILASDITSVDLVDIVRNQQLVYNWYKNLPASFSWSKYQVNPINWFPFWDDDYVSDEMILFAWNLDVLETDEIERQNVFNRLQIAYWDSILRDNQKFSRLVSLDSSSSDHASNYVAQTLNTALKMDIPLKDIPKDSSDWLLCNGITILHPNSWFWGEWGPIWEPFWEPFWMKDNKLSDLRETSWRLWIFKKVQANEEEIIINWCDATELQISDFPYGVTLSDMFDYDIKYIYLEAWKEYILETDERDSEVGLFNANGFKLYPDPWWAEMPQYQIRSSGYYYLLFTQYYESLDYTVNLGVENICALDLWYFNTDYTYWVPENPWQEWQQSDSGEPCTYTCWEGYIGEDCSDQERYCAVPPSYSNAYYNYWVPDTDNKSWEQRNYSSSDPCTYRCMNWYSGVDCSIQSRSCAAQPNYANAYYFDWVPNSDGAQRGKIGSNWSNTCKYQCTYGYSWDECDIELTSSCSWLSTDSGVLSFDEDTQTLISCVNDTYWGDGPCTESFVTPCQIWGVAVKNIWWTTKSDKSEVVNYEGGSAFWYINSLVLSDSIENIGSYAFSYNRIFELLIWTWVKTIEEGAFYSSSIVSLNIPNNVTFIWNDAFGQNNIKDLTIWTGISEISEWVFFGNSLTDVVIPNNIETISERAFLSNSIENITMWTNLKTIEKHAFKYNFLETLIIPNGVESIWEWAFENNLLTEIYIPASVTYIWEWAFKRQTAFWEANGTITYATQELKDMYHNDTYIDLSKITNFIVE